MPDTPAETSLGFERIVFFSDAVYAIVITLLVLPIAAEFEAPEEDAQLLHVIGELWPHILSFLISFLVIGQFWMAHHRMYRLIGSYNGGLLWMNLFCLLTVTFMPFPTAVLGAVRDEHHLEVVFYAASLTATSLALVLMWTYARTHDLLRPDLTTEQVKGFTVGSLVAMAAFVVSIGAAFFGLIAAAICWVAMIPATRFALQRTSRT
ncbi:TMEM175 family protein [Nakamurella sp.]|uniref:TMEM175 family protein n=1 Tax=Nakamurella sp. TaxID=1869182 RepID=UPI0037841FDA